jgi:hypothetical protein
MNAIIDKVCNLIKQYIFGCKEIAWDSLDMFKATIQLV